MTEKNADKLNAAAELLRKRGFPGDELVARILELCEPIATYWSEPYAAPFVPLLESALRLSRAVLAPEQAEPAPTVALPEPDFLPGYPGKLARPPAAMLARSQAEPLTAERIATYYLDHCENCRDAVFYGYSGNFARDAHAKHVPVIEDGCGPLAGQPCACKTCGPAEAVDRD